MSADRPVVTRFAPSPTGALHIGGARTALFAWAFAKKHQGRFILRIEDTDLKRSSLESTKGIVRDMAWLGLYSDEGPKYPCGKKGCGCGKASEDPGYDPYDRDQQLGENGPYFQSQRAANGIYDKYVQMLLDAGKAYEDDGAVRFRMDKDIAFSDAVYGDITVKADDLEDFIIRKGEDGGRLPTFHFAVVVDDALMEVTHVIRGQEHLTNTTKHAALYDTLAELTGDTETWQRPVWVHTPSIMNPGGSKMSKRDKAKMTRAKANDAIAADTEIDLLINGTIRCDATKQRSEKYFSPSNYQALPDLNPSRIQDFILGNNDEDRITFAMAKFLNLALPEIDVEDFRTSGYLQPALLNYIALLGWNPGDDIEHFGLNFMVAKFAISRIGKSNSTFDRTKLRDFNAKAIRELEIEDFASRMTRYAESERLGWIDKSIFTDNAKWLLFCDAVQERTHALPDPLDMNVFLISADDAISYDFTPKPARKAMMGNDGQGVSLLAEMCEAFDALPENCFGAAAHEKMNELAEASGINMGKYAQPIRIAVSGAAVTPPIDVTLDLLGKDAALVRMRRCLDAARAHLATTTS